MGSRPILKRDAAPAPAPAWCVDPLVAILAHAYAIAWCEYALNLIFTSREK